MSSGAFAIVSTMSGAAWGGSETLWHGVALELRRRGAAVHVFRPWWTPVPPPMAQLAAAGVAVTYRRHTPSLATRLLNRLAPRRARTAPAPVQTWLANLPQTKIFISCGSLLDDFSGLLPLADGAEPYALVVHAAAPELWPSDTAIAALRPFLLRARAVYFVSRHNLAETERMLGVVLPNASVVWCPLNITPALRADPAAVPFPAGDRLSLACVARLDIAAKGQDLLLQTLALEKWRARDVALTFYGAGPHALALRDMSRFLDLANVTFAGQVHDLAALWAPHHLGVLASRYEGLPLTLMEAMMLGRANVATAVCGNPEVIDDNVTGFLAAAPTVAALDEALERAWQRRHEFPALGQAAARRIRELTPADPCAQLADRLAALR